MKLNKLNKSVDFSWVLVYITKYKIDKCKKSLNVIQNDDGWFLFELV